MLELSEEDRAAFIKDVVTCANAIHAVFHPDKLNYGMYGDTGHHLHMHLVPKYKDEFEWGGIRTSGSLMKRNARKWQPNCVRRSQRDDPPTKAERTALSFRSGRIKEVTAGGEKRNEKRKFF